MDLQIIYKNNKPYGIRDSGGYLFFFVDIMKYVGQEERYRTEIADQYMLADYLLDALKKRKRERAPANEEQPASAQQALAGSEASTQICPTCLGKDPQCLWSGKLQQA